MAGETAQGPTQGVLRSIEDWEDVPQRLLEAIMEGMAKEPSKWIIIGLGFYLGWKGIDVFKYFTGTISAFTESVEFKGLVDSRVDFEKMLIMPGAPVKFVLDWLTGGKDAEAPKPESTEDLAKDPDATATDKWKHELEIRLVSGAIGALVAIMITQPGFMSGVGEIVKGIGELVPL